jgi:RNA polymerase sigma-70 factor (ECF subfamily)
LGYFIASEEHAGNPKTPSSMNDLSTTQPNDPQPTDWVPTTHWSVVLAAGQGTSPQAAVALEQLCRLYWYPLYAYIRRRGCQIPEAQDLTQEFFARLLKDHWLAGVHPSKGKFRAFLLAALNHFLANEWNRSHAAKRGGGRPLISLDDTAEARYALEPASDLTPEKVFERRWALTLFEQALARLQEEHRATSTGRHFECLKGFLSSEPSEGEYCRVGTQLEMTPGAVSAAVYRLRQRYRALVRDEIARTVSDPAEVDEEIRSLLAALAE